jgi:hypothetical protein
MADRDTAQHPTMQPPADASQDVGAGSGSSEPSQLTEQGFAEAVGSMSSTDSAPTLEPPASSQREGVTEGVTASVWRSGTVTAFWAINEHRNAWMQVSGVGWKRIYNGRDGAFQALTTLAAQARQTGRQIHFREESDGMVYEIYLW